MEMGMRVVALSTGTGTEPRGAPAVDGLMAPTSAFPDWLQVGFAAAKTIDEVDVFTVQDDYGTPKSPNGTTTFGLYGVTDFQVQYWTGAAWATVPGGTIAGNRLIWRQIIFSPITTTSIRVLVSGSLNGYSRIVELEAYEEDAAPPPPPRG